MLTQWKDLKINEKRLLIKAENSVEQTVLPKQFKKFVFEEKLNKMGRLGFDRVFELCKNCVSWPKYESEIKNYVTEGCKCLKDKKPVRSKGAPLETTSTTQTFELIKIDYLHLDQCKGEYEYLLVVVDRFTKFAQAFSTEASRGGPQQTCHSTSIS